MNDQMAVRVRDTFTSAQKKHQLLAQIYLHRTNINGNSVDVLHDKVWPAIVCVSGVDQASDRRMIEAGKELTLSEETLAPAGLLAVCAQEFHSNLGLDLTVDALGQIDGTHPACAENTNAPIRPPLQRHGFVIGLQDFFRRIDNTLTYAVFTRGIEAQKSFYFGSQLSSDLMCGEKLLPLAWRQVCEFVE